MNKQQYNNIPHTMEEEPILFESINCTAVSITTRHEETKSVSSSSMNTSRDLDSESFVGAEGRCEVSKTDRCRIFGAPEIVIETSHVGDSKVLTEDNDLFYNDPYLEYKIKQNDPSYYGPEYDDPFYEGPIYLINNEEY